ncbi:MAG: hypothetical protein U0324_32755 [Polyangiales bacterium]
MDALSSTTLAHTRKYRAKRHEDPLLQSIRVAAHRARETGERRVSVPPVPGVERAIEKARREFPGVEFFVGSPASSPIPSDRLPLERAPLEDFLERVYSLSQSDREAALLDLIYDTLDDMLLDEQFGRCDAALARVDVRRLSAVAMVGFLTITLTAKHLLPSRVALVARIREDLRGSRSPAEIDELLKGLA